MLYTTKDILEKGETILTIFSQHLSDGILDGHIQKFNMGKGRVMLLSFPLIAAFRCMKATQMFINADRCKLFILFQ